MNLLDIDDLAPGDLAAVLDLAERSDPPRVLERCGVALLFEKPSARTRHSTELAVVQLGGHPVTVRPDEVGLDSREPVEDVARTLAGYHAAICARVFDHTILERMAAVVDVPVVNLLSDVAHPLQAVADLLTVRQELGRLEGVTLAWVGDGNNVARSLVTAARMVGVDVRIATPRGFELPGEACTNDPREAVAGADVVATDVWTSMGQEDEAARRREQFQGFTIDADLMAAAAPGAVFLHCLPVHRGEEATAEVVDGPQSRIWPQAANRLAAARGALGFLLRSEARS